MHSFVISDVVGDDPAVVASGPSIASPFEPDRALAVLADSGFAVDASLAALISAAAPPDVPVHPVHVIADARTALEAATRVAETKGWRVLRIGDALAGDAAETGRQHAALALKHAAASRPCLLVSGGELTVQVRARNGRGGPNLEYLTGLMAGLPESAPVAALACDSDGIDGSEDNAGGWFDAGRRAPTGECEAALAANRSYDLFERLGGLVKTGPTRTNVNDIRLIAVGAPS
jgi:glycerate-2-kinase